MQSKYSAKVSTLSMYPKFVGKCAIWFLAMSACVAPLYAAHHPVPLEKDTKEDKCLECHRDHTEGKVVHPAVQMGCFTCHFIRGSGDDTRIVLKNARAITLCTSCHEDKKAADPKKHVHAPVAVDCLKCHNPHSSPNKALLNLAPSGDKDTNLCLGCHAKGLGVTDKGSRHAALDVGCDACHVTHKTGEKGNDELYFHLTKAPPKLCLGCHDASDKSLIEAHRGQPFATADCTTCHDPHDSKSPKLLQKYVHMPFGEKMCDTCHAAPKDGKVVLTKADARSVCITCHDEQAKKIESAKVVHPGAQSDCTECHSPHAGRYPRFLRPDPVTVCEGCHDNRVQEHKLPVQHAPVFQQGCSLCHAPHGGDRPHLLRAPVNDLCLSCHGSKATGTKVAESTDVTILDSGIVLSEGFINSVPRLDLSKTGLGHPLQKHPTSGIGKNILYKGEITCSTCHNPHAGAKGLFVTGTADGAPLCSRCHEDVGAITAAPGATGNKGKKKK
jgi:predicted CXXCH cytochrome family protein